MANEAQDRLEQRILVRWVKHEGSIMRDGMSVVVPLFRASHDPKDRARIDCCRCSS